MSGKSSIDTVIIDVLPSYALPYDDHRGFPSWPHLMTAIFLDPSNPSESDFRSDGGEIKLFRIVF